MAGDPRVTVAFPECDTGIALFIQWVFRIPPMGLCQRDLQTWQKAEGKLVCWLIVLVTWYSLESPEKALLSWRQDLSVLPWLAWASLPRPNWPWIHTYFCPSKCWEESPNEEFSRLGWPVGLSMGVCLDCWLMQEDPECGWHRFIASILDSLRVEKASWVADSQGSIRLCSSLWGRCDCLCEFLPWFPCRKGL